MHSLILSLSQLLTITLADFFGSMNSVFNYQYSFHTGGCIYLKFALNDEVLDHT